jgi:hypothetical protein
MYSSLRVIKATHQHFFYKKNIHIVAKKNFENFEKLIIVNSNQIAPQKIKFPKLSKQQI